MEDVKRGLISFNAAALMHFFFSIPIIIMRSPGVCLDELVTEHVHSEALYSTLLRFKYTKTEGTEGVKKGLISFSAAAHRFPYT
ncbi:hypothetical protein DUNSADRAFT_2264 [Dunaliella salina]|uniref:Uncharacterized protein n=1 Tax=Dunaliella salina TaxID=3046 RepID=A0ABQ7FWI6_DUNSA|nr:hypothetical protein DUNSADRAFT_2264 [Dunaliella salina]|eukprot:KAF5826720.1 hypothetical protein DUNSADRAFT_2264 [Dunaliella salina]